MRYYEIINEMVKIKKHYSQLRKETKDIDEFTRLLECENDELSKLKANMNSRKFIRRN